MSMTQSAGVEIRSWRQAMGRGARGHCPACGQGALFGRYLKTREFCANCGLAIHEHRADDAPPYITMTIIGHLVVLAALLLERFFSPSIWVQFALILPLTLILTLLVLPRVKGALIGLQWANRMHGFDDGAG